MTIPIRQELDQIRNRLYELGRATQDENGESQFEAIKKSWPEAMALIGRRRQLWNSQEGKDLGLNVGVDHEIFY